MKPLDSILDLKVGQILTPFQVVDEFYIVESIDTSQIHFKKADIKGNSIEYSQVSITKEDFLSNKWLTPHV
jgi:hypothetical protein